MAVTSGVVAENMHPLNDSIQQLHATLCWELCSTA